MKAARISFFLAAIAYLLLIFPFTAYLKTRPLQQKVGYVPDAKVLKYILADQRYAVADWVVLKVLFYFGSLMENAKGDTVFSAKPDYPGMFRILQTGLRLEPYDADAYYFAQAAFTWEIGRYAEVNNMLEYGMKYRKWDYQLPFFIGFNSAYFMKDFKKAAEYMKKAAEIAGDQQFATLASRYFYEAGETDFAILFIDTMKRGAKDANEKKLYEYRRRALVAIREIERAAKGYGLSMGRPPRSIEELVAGGFLPKAPKDPYGGRFYLEQGGKVRSSSKLSFAGARAAAENQK